MSLPFSIVYSVADSYYTVQIVSSSDTVRTTTVVRPVLARFAFTTMLCHRVGASELPCSSGSSRSEL